MAQNTQVEELIGEDRFGIALQIARKTAQLLSRLAMRYAIDNERTGGRTPLRGRIAEPFQESETLFPLRRGGLLETRKRKLHLV